MKIDVGKTTITGWAVALAGFLPTVIKLLEGANHLSGPQQVAALTGLISLAVTHLGRYGQAIVKAKAS